MVNYGDMIGIIHGTNGINHEIAYHGDNMGYNMGYNWDCGGME